MSARSGGRTSRSLVGRRLGRYEVLAKLASGGMASVYAARAQGVAGFERLVAIKILHSNLAHEQEFVSMFLDEARLAARIRHPNVVPTLDISDSIDVGYFIVMEYIEGEHLGKLLVHAARLAERVPQPAVMRIVIDTLSGLGAAHKLTGENGKPLNLVHRDASPHNIMVGLDGISRLTDFGVAKAEDRLTHTRNGEIKGKLSYMAPEQASVARTDPRSDLFSIGIILWESLTGAHLFRSETAAGTLNKLVSEPIPMPSLVDPALGVFDPLLNKALSRDPEARFQSADDFSEALEKLAPRVGGVASLREVSKVVEKFASERIGADKKRIKEAIQTFGSGDQAVAAHLSGGDDSTSEPSNGSCTPSSASPISRSGRIAGAHSGPSRTSGIYPHGISSSYAGRGLPLRPPPPPRRPSAARTEDFVEISGANLELSEVSAVSASQVGSPASYGKLLAVLVVCCVLLAGVTLWAMFREPNPGGVRVIQMENEPTAEAEEPQRSALESPEKSPPKPEAKPLDRPEKREAVRPPKPPHPSQRIHRPARASKPPRASKPRKLGRSAVTAPKRKKPDPRIPAGVLEPSSVKDKSAPRRKPGSLDELDPVNPYR